MKCSKCGYENEPGAIFCEHCGSRLLPETPNKPINKEWYYAIHGQSKGPCAIDEIKSLFLLRSIDVNTYVWRDGMPDWVQFGNSLLAKECFDNQWFCLGEEQLYGPISKEELVKWYDESRIDIHTFVWTYGKTRWEPLKSAGILPGLQMENEDEKQWYSHIKNENMGPFTKQEMLDMYQDGTLNDRSMVWKKGQESWEEFSRTELYDALPISDEAGVVKKNNIPWVKGIGIAVIVIVACIGGFIFYQNQTSHQQALQQAQQEAKNAKEQAQTSKEKAEKAQEEKESAQKEQEEAEKAQKEAEKAQQEAEQQAKEAQAAQQKAEEQAKQAQQEAAQKENDENTSSSSSEAGNYTVDTNGRDLIVRDEPGTNGKAVSKLADGSSVRVTNTKQVNGQTWGQIGTDMWIFMTDGQTTYLTKDE